MNPNCCICSRVCDTKKGLNAHPLCIHAEEVVCTACKLEWVDPAIRHFRNKILKTNQVVSIRTDIGHQRALRCLIPQ